MLKFKAPNLPFIRLIFLRNGLQIPENLKKPKIICRLVPIPRGSNDFFTATRIHRKIVTQHKFKGKAFLRRLVLYDEVDARAQLQ
jgi:hypothetical protein